MSINFRLYWNKYCELCASFFVFFTLVSCHFSVLGYLYIWISFCRLRKICIQQACVEKISVLFHGKKKENQVLHSLPKKVSKLLKFWASPWRFHNTCNTTTGGMWPRCLLKSPRAGPSNQQHLQVTPSYVGDLSA